MIRLQQTHINFILDFLKIQESNNPIETEISIYKKKRLGLERQLKDLEIYECLIPELKSEIERNYRESLITPGECVGIIGAQSMGECITQATLNTFHVAGTNVNTGASRFQDLINASKIIRENTLTLYFKDVLGYTELSQSLTCVYFSTIVKGVSRIKEIPKSYFLCRQLFTASPGPGTPGEARRPTNPNRRFEYIFLLNICMWSIYRYRILPSKVKKILEKEHLCEYLYLPFSSGSDKVILLIDTPNLNAILETKLFGIKGIKDYEYSYDGSTEKAITIGGTISNLSLSPLRDIIDFRKIKSDNIWEIYKIFGIEAAKHFLIKELKAVMGNVGLCHIKLLAANMTHSGTIKPMTRYTMRGHKGPLSKASFEESMETFIKAAKYKEQDNLEGVSASIIVGKKPKTGTYNCDLLIDLHSLGLIPIVGTGVVL